MMYITQIKRVVIKEKAPSFSPVYQHASYNWVSPVEKVKHLPCFLLLSTLSVMKTLSVYLIGFQNVLGNYEGSSEALCGFFGWKI